MTETAPMTDVKGPRMTSHEPSSEAASSEDLTQNTQDVVVALLRQQEALLTELRWAYDQLERVQDAELTELRERVAQLESRKRTVAPAQTTASLGSFAQKTRRRVEFTLQEPRLAARAAKRKLKKIVPSSEQQQ